MIKYACPHCSAHLDFPDEDAGQSRTCDHCSGKITVPRSFKEVEDFLERALSTESQHGADESQTQQGMGFLIVTCTCGQQMKAPETALGKTSKCLGCGKQFLVTERNTSVGEQPPREPELVAKVRAEPLISARLLRGLRIACFVLVIPVVLTALVAIDPRIDPTTPRTILLPAFAFGVFLFIFLFALVAPSIRISNAPISARLLRGLAIVCFAISLLFLSGAFSSAFTAHKSLLSFLTTLAMSAFGASALVLSTLSISVLSKRILIYEGPQEKSYDGWLVAILLGGIGMWGQMLPAVSDRVYLMFILIGFVLAVPVGIGVLFKSRQFVVRNYIVVGVAIVSCFSSIAGPAVHQGMARARAVARTNYFGDIIEECKPLPIIYALALRAAYESPTIEHAISRPEGSLLLLILLSAEDKDEPLTLRVDSWESYVSSDLLASEPSDVRLVAIRVGPSRRRSLGFPLLGPGPATYDVPVLFISWPDKEVVGSARLTAKVKHVREDIEDIWSWWFLNRSLVSELEKTLSGTPIERR